jgi:HlyD family secretion protein
MIKNITSKVLLALTVLALLAPACSRNNGKQLSGSGIIEVTEVTVRSKVTGRVAEMPFDEGQQVEAGKVVARLAHDELSAQERQALAAVSAAQSQAAAAQANFNTAEDSYQRNQPLYQSGTISIQAFTQIENQRQAARSQLEASKGLLAQAQAALSLARAQVANSYIEAPISGVMLEKNIEAGELALPGTPVCKLGDITRPYIKIYLPEKEYGRIKLGQKAKITVDSYPGQEFEGAVAVIAGQAEFTPKDVQTKEERTKLVFAVKINLQNPRGELKPGMPADAVIEME